MFVMLGNFCLLGAIKKNIFIYTHLIYLGRKCPNGQCHKSGKNIMSHTISLNLIQLHTFKKKNYLNEIQINRSDIAT